MASTILDRLQASASSVLLWAVATALLVAPAARAQSGCSGDINGDGKVDGVDLAIVLTQWGNCPANITSVSPSQGSVLGGTVITIEGTGLASTSAVRVGGVLCTNLQVLSATQVRATTPPGAVGQATVEITTPSGTSLAPTPFTYAMQSVSSITPTSGLFSGGTPITIQGQFLAGTTSVMIGGVPATNVVAVNASAVTAVTPPGSVGAADVVVIGSKGAITVSGGFTYLSANTPPWATPIEAMPDPAVVTDATLRDAIIATGWAWRVRDNATQIEMLLIPPGSYDMGCSPGPFFCHQEELPVHSVTFESPFYIGRYEVTQAQWTAVAGSNPSYFAGVNYPDSDQRPVDNVSWSMAAEFAGASGLRLPTEAEWEYAYRAGTTTSFHSMPGFPNGSEDETQIDVIAWYSPNSDARTQPVGLRASNGFGLHDMSGNVEEWVNDWWSSVYYSMSPAVNPPGPAKGGYRVLRGGSWGFGGSGVRASSRRYAFPSYADYGFGFRVARNP